jgi:hypothetical protein
VTFQELTNVPISKIDTIIDVVSKGDGTQELDEVFVTSTITLAADIDASEEATLLLPLAQETQQKPIVRYTSDAITGNAVFEFDEVDRSVYDQEVVDKLEALADGATKKEQRALAEAIGKAADGLSAAVVKVQPGQRELRIFYAIAAKKAADAEKEFEFAVVGPLPSFVIQTGGSIGVVAALPRGTAAVSSGAFQDLSGQGSELPDKVEADLGGRHLIGWVWKNDPLFKIRYRYA